MLAARVTPRCRSSQGLLPTATISALAQALAVMLAAPLSMRATRLLLLPLQGRQAGRQMGWQQR